MQTTWHGPAYSVRYRALRARHALPPCRTRAHAAHAHAHAAQAHGIEGWCRGMVSRAGPWCRGLVSRRPRRAGCCTRPASHTRTHARTHARAAHTQHTLQPLRGAQHPTAGRARGQACVCTSVCVRHSVRAASDQHCNRGADLGRGVGGGGVKLLPDLPPHVRRRRHLQRRRRDLDAAPARHSRRAAAPLRGRSHYSHVRHQSRVPGEPCAPVTAGARQSECMCARAR